jgi:thiol-disulfide isomerase/thioredoxin
VLEQRTDDGLGDLELRVRQAASPWLAGSRWSAGAAIGAALPTGDYVARSGAANLPEEAAGLALGRGVTWWLVEVDGRREIARRGSAFAQITARGPLGRTDDDYQWGPEARATVGGRIAVGWRLAAVVSTDVQWQAGATEPDPFDPGGRLDAASVGGWHWTVSPAIAIDLPGGVAAIAGARVPIADDVVGNQLVAGVGAFFALSISHAVTRRPPPVARRPVESPGPAAGTITVIDYWASWCAPCREVERLLDAAAPRWPDVRIVRVDVTTPPDGTNGLPSGASGLPAIEIFDDTGARWALLFGDEALQVVDRIEALRRGESR